jgi:hypothetical protein
MALSPQLQQFKSSGVYRLEFDKSQTVNIPAETIRLVVGRSKKGPYNIPVLVEDVEQFIQVFGGVDKSLEKKNMFFHRSAIECLSRGPILALNLTTADDDDRVSVFAPVTNSSVENLGSMAIQASEGASKKFSDVFDTDKFWVPSDEKLLAATLAGENHAISFVNIKQDPITVIIRQAADVRGFEVTARNWYGEANIPEGIDADEYVSDYMVDVFVFKGKFDAQALNNDPTYGDFFTSEGLEKDKLAQFVGLREVSLLAQYTGSLIPEFMDNEGRQLYIETLINLEARRTGLFCAVDEEELTNIDLIGNGFNVYQDYEVLSHKVSQSVTPKAVDLTAFNATAKVDGNQLVLKGSGLNVAALQGLTDNPIVVGEWLHSATPGEFVSIENMTDTNADEVTIQASGNILNTGNQGFSYERYSAAANNATFNATANVRVDEDGNLIFKVAGDAGFAAGDVLLDAGNEPVTYLPSEDAGVFVGINSVEENYDDAVFGPGCIKVSPYGGARGFSASLEASNITEFGGYKLAELEATHFDLHTLNLNTRAVAAPQGWTFNNQGNGIFNFSKVGGAQSDFADWKVGMYVPGEGGKLSRILKIVMEVAGDSTVMRFTTHRVVVNEPTYALKRYEESAGIYKTFPLEGATQSHKDIGGLEGLLSAIKPGTGLGNALVDKDNITFRYVVDTFGSLENGGLLNKEELTLLCKERQNASAIINAPMVKEFKASTNPSFLNELSGAFDVNNVATGGNLNLNPSALYTLPSINEGATYGFYYGPGLNVVENGRTKVVPPAAYVSNNYIDKYSDALPWSIVAGPRRGVVGGSGVQSLEFAFDKNDRDVLEPFGYNPIVFERGVGLTIKGNKTAQQGIQSALSSAHVREALIYIEDGLAEILKNYLFEFNNAQTRLEIKTLADNFMESVKKDGGVYDYRNIMDTTNNTNEVIDNNMGILDTFVEPVKGLEILVSRVTVLNTGEIASGNFA